jgi:hypothetical protein
VIDMNHVMIDLESLGTCPSSAFVSIGAVKFSPSTGEIGDTFYERIDWGSACDDFGRCIDVNTLLWWFQQNDAARQEICKPGKPLDEVLNLFTEWLPDDPIVWGNGATFDISMLENAYNFKAPWKFWNVRDVRTIVDLTQGYVDKGNMVGTKHDALDDAIHQAKFVSKMYMRIREGLDKTDKNKQRRRRVNVG